MKTLPLSQRSLRQATSSPPAHRDSEVEGGRQLQFLRCRPGEDERLVRLQDIVECIPMVQLDEQRGADHPHHRGLLHFRGRVVPVFDIAADQGPDLEPEWFLVVLRGEQQEIALVAREVSEIFTCAEEACEEVHIGTGRILTVVGSSAGMLRVVEPTALLEP